ncbi:hypothetical protein LPJ66_011282, partial [Kickxella alabastrina]
MNSPTTDAVPSASSSKTPTTGMGPGSSHFGFLNSPAFAAGMDRFRQHYGQDPECKITEGYTFLGLHKANFSGSSNTQQQQQHQSNRLTSGSAGRAHANLDVSPAHSSSSQPQQQTLRAAKSAHDISRGGRLPPHAVAAANATAAAAVSGGSAASSAAAHIPHSGQLDSESTLDHLLSYIEKSPS